MAALLRTGGGEEEGSAEYDKQPIALPLSLSELRAAVSDDSSDDEDGTGGGCDDGPLARLTEEAAFKLLLDWHGLLAEQAASVTALSVFQQHRYRRLSGLQPFSALQQLEVIHQSQPTKHSAPLPHRQTALANEAHVMYGDARSTDHSFRA